MLNSFIESLLFLLKQVYHSLLAPSGPFFTPDQYPDLHGQKWLITGATGGIGLATARVLASLGAELWLVGRNDGKLRAAQQDVLRHANASHVHSLLIDFADMTTIKPAVTFLKQQTSHLNGIIHNAGVMNVPMGSHTRQGLELTVGVNNVASQFLQNLLDPLIVDDPQGRIVWLSSAAHVSAPDDGAFDLASLITGPTGRIYAMSKAWNYYQAVQWSVNHPNSMVKSVSVHPGMIKSDLTRTTSGALLKIVDWFGATPDKGTLPMLYAALSPTVANNEYVIPYGRPGLVRPDIVRGARGEPAEAALAWIQEQIANFQSGK